MLETEASQHPHEHTQVPREVSEEERIFVDQFVEDFEEQRRSSTKVGLGMVAAAGATVMLFASDKLTNLHLGRVMPFSAEAQQILNSVDNYAAAAGTVVFPAALAVIGGAKLVARHNSKVRRADKWSSQEMTNEGHGGNNLGRRMLRKTFAGGLPVVATLGVALAGVTTAIGVEVSEGPSRPIRAIGETLGGHTYIVQDNESMPMHESAISRDLATKVGELAQQKSIKTSTLDLGLGNTTTTSGQKLSSLFIGLQHNSNSPISWDSSSSCNETPVPVLVDGASHFRTGQQLELRGQKAVVAGYSDKEVSAINRLGIVMDEDALATCIQKDSLHSHHLIALDTDVLTAQALLDNANTEGEAATVISDTQYMKNSQKFWEANVKPITNVLASISALMAAVAMSSEMKSRLTRNRREWAAKLGAGGSRWHMRGTELLRSTKDGVLASIVGTAVSIGVTPGVNLVESGMQAGADKKTILAGVGFGVIASVVGGATRLLRIEKSINPRENTRI